MLYAMDLSKYGGNKIEKLSDAKKKIMKNPKMRQIIFGQFDRHIENLKNSFISVMEAEIESMLSDPWTVLDPNDEIFEDMKQEEKKEKQRLHDKYIEDLNRIAHDEALHDEEKIDPPPSGSPEYQEKLAESGSWLSKKQRLMEERIQKKKQLRAIALPPQHSTIIQSPNPQPSTAKHEIDIKESKLHSKTDAAGMTSSSAGPRPSKIKEIKQQTLEDSMKLLKEVESDLSHVESKGGKRYLTQEKPRDDRVADIGAVFCIFFI